MTQSSVHPRIGTRGSPLALAQAHMVRGLLAAARRIEEAAIEIRVIRTTGDAIQDRPLSDVGGKGLFTKEIEQVLLDGAIDLAVHSAKDMVTVLPAGLVLAGCLPREDVRDVLVSRIATSFEAMPKGAVIGTASLRRQAQVLRLRPDLKVAPMRGNVGTRLDKLARGEADATILALAGLKRLGVADAATAILSVDQFLPAVGQGAIAIESRIDDVATREAIAAISDDATITAVMAERAFLAVLDGSCRTPIAGHARIENGELLFRGLIAKPDGSATFETSRRGGVGDAAALGADAAQELKGLAGPDFFVPG
jgi:hydroxymethylbilane synthase